MGNCGSGGGGSVKELTEQDKTNIRQTWAIFSSGDIVENGAQLYFNLFKQHPEAKELFGFARGKEQTNEELLANKQFKGHVKKVMDVIASAVNSLDNLSDVAPALKELGARHYSYHGVTVKQFAYIGQSLLFAIEKKVGDDFKSKKKSWVAVYGIIEVAMKSGMMEASREQREA